MIIILNKSAMCDVRFDWESPPVRNFFFSRKKLKSIGTLFKLNRTSHFALIRRPRGALIPSRMLHSRNC